LQIISDIIRDTRRDARDSEALTRLDVSGICLCGGKDFGDGEKGVYKTTGLTALAKSISGLKELSISNNALKAEGARILTPAIEASGALSWLNILKNDIGKEQAQALIKIKHQRKMITLCGLKHQRKKLNLRGKMNGAADALMLAEEIKDMGSLITISLAGSNLKDEGAALLLAAITR
jgi:hypothetical protein